MLDDHYQEFHYLIFTGTEVNRSDDDCSIVMVVCSCMLPSYYILFFSPCFA